MWDMRLWAATGNEHELLSAPHPLSDTLPNKAFVSNTDLIVASFVEASLAIQLHSAKELHVNMPTRLKIG